MKFSAMWIVTVVFNALLISTFAQAQSTPEAPEGFYRDAGSKTGYELKSALKKIITRTHKPQSYSALYEVYFISDIDTTYENDGTIMDMYSENPNDLDDYGFILKQDRCGSYKREADCFNREHIFPQGAFHKQAPMKSDFFHIYPTDGYVNNKRGSYPFGEVDAARWISSNGSKVGVHNGEGYNGTVFEPIDEFKGDIARALFYFATRYEDRIHRWKHPMINGSRNQAYRTWFIKLLLKWNEQDPVSKHEARRNDFGFRFQKNRNPFIDNPDWANEIWGHKR